MKRQISRESVGQAIEAGARNMTQIAHAHGYRGNVSGDVTKVIRKVFPGVGEVLAGVKAGKAYKPAVEAPAVVVEQRKAPYHGPVYGKVFEVAVQVGSAEGAKPRKDLVAMVARKTELSETQVSYALQVFTTPKHQSNQGRSRNAAGQRGHVLLVPVEG